MGGGGEPASSLTTHGEEVGEVSSSTVLLRPPYQGQCRVALASLFPPATAQPFGGQPPPPPREQSCEVHHALTTTAGADNPTL